MATPLVGSGGGVSRIINLCQTVPAMVLPVKTSLHTNLLWLEKLFTRSCLLTSHFFKAHNI